MILHNTGKKTYAHTPEGPQERDALAICNSCGICRFGRSGRHAEIAWWRDSCALRIKPGEIAYTLKIDGIGPVQKAYGMPGNPTRQRLPDVSSRLPG